MNWNDPAARLALIESVGPAEYNRRMKADEDARNAADPLFGKQVNVLYQGKVVLTGKVVQAIDSRWGALVKLDTSGESFYQRAQCQVVA